MRHCGSFLGLLAIAVIVAIPAKADALSKVVGEHFEIFTTGSSADATEALAALEQAHAYFAATNVIKTEGETPLRVIAFHSTEEYASYRLHQNAFGHFFRGSTRSFIVLTDLRPEHREALLHEYTHAVVRQAGLTLPQWLNEGIADLYSSLSVADGQAVAGLPLSGRIRTLDSYGLVPLAQLFSSGTLASNGRNAAALYAESWALTHMLRFHPAYAGSFARLLQSSTKNMDNAQALRQIFGKDLAQIESDLQLYMSSLPAACGAGILLQPQTVTGNAQLASSLENDTVLDNLLEEQPWTRLSVHRQAE